MLDNVPVLRSLRLARFARWFPLIVLIVAAMLRFHQIGQQSLWNDEGNSLRLAQREAPALIAAAALDIHPPGYYLLLRAWIGLVGISEFGLRSLSAFCSLLTVAFTYALGKRLAAPGMGLVAAAVVAVSGFQVYYAQETRMYALLGLCAAASMWAFVRWTARPRLVRAVVLLLVNAAGLYTHYAFPAVMVTEGIFVVALIIARGRRRPALAWATFWRFFALNLGTLVLFWPLASTAIRQVTGWPRTGQPVAPLTGLGTVAQWLTFGNTASAIDWYAYIWPVVFTLAALLPDWFRRRQPLAWRVLLPFGWLLLTVGAFFALGQYREANLKFLIPCEIAMALIIGRGIWLLWELGTASPVVFTEALPRILAVMGALSGIYYSGVALNNLYTSSFFARDDYRAMARVIREAPRAGDVIILDAPNQREVFTYYYQDQAPIYPLPAGLGGDDATTRASVGGVISGAKRIYALYWGESERDPNRIVENTLNAQTFPVYSRYYGDVRFVVYAVPGAVATEPATRTDALFGADSARIRLVGYSVDQRTPQQGDVVGVTLFWQAERPITKRYKVFVQLLDDSGRLVAQRDSEPGNGQKLTTTWTPAQTVIDPNGLLIPPTLPTGDYRLIIGLYDLDSPTDRLAAEGADSFSLGVISVRAG
jgi:hypothetical protein